MCAATAALRARAALPPVLTEATAATSLAEAAHLSMPADADAAAGLAAAALPPMLTYAAAAAIPALALPPPVLA